MMPVHFMLLIAAMVLVTVYGGMGEAKIALMANDVDMDYDAYNYSKYAVLILSGILGAVGFGMMARGNAPMASPSSLSSLSL